MREHADEVKQNIVNKAKNVKVHSYWKQHEDWTELDWFGMLIELIELIDLVGLI